MHALCVWCTLWQKREGCGADLLQLALVCTVTVADTDCSCPLVCTSCRCPRPCYAARTAEQAVRPWAFNGEEQWLGMQYVARPWVLRAPACIACLHRSRSAPLLLIRACSVIVESSSALGVSAWGAAKLRTVRAPGGAANLRTFASATLSRSLDEAFINLIHLFWR